MNHASHLALLSACFCTIHGLPAQEEPKGSKFAGRYFDVVLDFDNPAIAKQAAEIGDLAWDIAAELFGSKGAKPKSRGHVEFHADRKTHDRRVHKVQPKHFTKKDKKPPRTEGTPPEDVTPKSSKIPYTYTTGLKMYAFVGPMEIKTGELAKWGLRGTASHTVNDAFASMVTSYRLSFMCPFWLSQGLQAVVHAKLLHAQGRTSRLTDPRLSAAVFQSWLAWQNQTVPTVDEILTDRRSYDGVHLATRREFVMMLMERHEKQFRKFIRKEARREGFYDSKALAKKSAANLKRLIGSDVDLNAEFRDHCKNLLPEWGGSPMLRFDPGPRRQILAASAGKYRFLLKQALPVATTDFEISGSFSILDRDQRVAILVFDGPPLLDRRDQNRKYVLPVSIKLNADGTVTLLDGMAARSGAGRFLASTTGPKLALDTPHALRVKVRGKTIEVHLRGKKVLSHTLDREVPKHWGLAAPAGSATIWHDVACLDRGQALKWIEDLSHIDRADKAAAALRSKGPAALALLAKQLRKSPHLEDTTPDPVLAVVHSFGHSAGGAAEAVLTYLEKCNTAQVIPVLDTLLEISTFASTETRALIAKSKILAGPPPTGTKKADWLAKTFEAKQRLAVAVHAPIADLIKVVKKNRVFAREVAAIALGVRESKAVAAVPSLLKNLKTKKALAKGARDLKVDGKAVTLRDQYFARCSEALLVIAPNDPRIYPVYSLRLAEHADTDVRVAAAEMLGQFGDKAGRAVKSMALLLKDKTDERVLIATIKALAKMGKPAAKAKYHLGRLTRSTKISKAVRDASTATLKVLEARK